MECLRHVAPVVCLCLVVGGCGGSEAEQAQLQAQATRGSSIPEQMGHRPSSRVYSATVRGGGNRRTLSAFTRVLPGRETEQARDVAVDAVGNIIIVGGTQSPDFPVSHDLTLADGAGAVGSAGPMSVFVDGLGNIYVWGETGSSDLPASIKTVFHGRTDIWVAKFSSPLQQAPALEYLGGTERDAQRSLWIDAEGNLISTEWINVGSFFDGSGDVYVARILMP